MTVDWGQAATLCVGIVGAVAFLYIVLAFFLAIADWWFDQPWSRRR